MNYRRAKWCLRASDSLLCVVRAVNRLSGWLLFRSAIWSGRASGYLERLKAERETEKRERSRI